MSMSESIDKYYMIPLEKISNFIEVREQNSRFPSYLYVDLEYNVRISPKCDSQFLKIHDKTAWNEYCNKYYYAADNKYSDLKLHRWNESFLWKPTTGPFRLISEDQARFYDENGFVVLPNALSAPIVARLIEETDQIESEQQKVLASLDGGKGFIARANEISFTTHIVRKSQFVRNFYASQLFRDIAHDFVGNTVRLYWDQAVYKKAGVQKMFPWHQDNGYTFVAPQQYITVWIALNDANKENGCMWFVPKVHQLGTVEHELTDLGYALYVDSPPINAIPIECSAGTVIVLSALCPHMTAHNSTQETRRALVAQFVEDGSYQLTSDPQTDAPIRQSIEDERRQYVILKNGQPLI